MTTTKTNWTGLERLRDMLVPVDDVRPHPNNPRRGDAERMYDSLVRFGQMKPIVVDEQGTIITGHNLHAVAVERLGWSHVAAVALDGVDDVTAFEYLVADNFVSDGSDYDQREAQIAAEGLRAMVADLASRLETETDAAERDSIAGSLAGLEKAAEALESVGAVRQAGGDVAEAEVEWCCPKCHAGWRGEA